MAEKHVHEEVAPDNTLDRYPTAKSEGLHHDHIAAEALGGHTSDLPKGYYYSSGFIGTVVVSLVCAVFDNQYPDSVNRLPVSHKSPAILDGYFRQTLSRSSTRPSGHHRISYGFPSHGRLVLQ